MMKQFVYIICVILLPTQLFGGTLTYERANQLYHNQAYTEALELYNQMIAEGLVNASVYYNAGNTYYKLNKMGWAVWCFEKAQLLQPNNSSIQENLQLAIRKINSPIRASSATSLENYLQKIVQFHAQNTWSYIALLFFCIAMALLIVKQIRPIHPIFIAFRKLSWMLFVLYFMGTMGNYIYYKLYKYAIIVENTILYNAPKEKGLHKATNTKGVKVQILKFVKGGILNTDRYQIKLPNNDVVFVDANTIQIL